MLGTLRKLIDQAFQSLKACIEAELHSFKLSIESLSSRVSQLEESGITNRICHTLDHTLDQTSIDPSICPGTIVENQLLELSAKVVYIPHIQLENNKDKEKRKC